MGNNGTGIHRDCSQLIIRTFYNFDIFEIGWCGSDEIRRYQIIRDIQERGIYALRQTSLINPC